jgi:hypothetical protein
MSVHDGIPFLEYLRGKQKIFLNPSLIVSIEDASPDELLRRKSTAKTMALVWFTGADVTDNKQALAFNGYTAEELVKEVNRVMTTYKEKLAEKALLDEQN